MWKTWNVLVFKQIFIQEILLHFRLDTTRLDYEVYWYVSLA